MFRFEAHYHPYGEETFDRQKVGIKFYPKGVVPKYVVTSHRIRTGVGNDWVLNRERIEDLLLRAGPQAVDRRAGDADRRARSRRIRCTRAALLSIPPNTVARHERFWPLPKPALIISFQPHMHFRGSRMLLEAIHPDGRREMLTDATHYEQNWQITYKYKTPHLFPAGTILHTVSWHDNTANNKHNPDPDRVGRLGQPDDGRNGPRLDGHRVPDRRAVSGGTGEAARAATHDHDAAAAIAALVRCADIARPPAAARCRRMRAVCFCCASPPQSRSAAPTNGEWRTWGGDLGVTRYAPLDQINAANFNKLADRLALQDRESRQAPRLQSADHAADGQRRALRHRRRASQRRRDQRRDRRAAVDAPARGGQARRRLGAAAVGPRRRLLDRRQGRRAHLLRHDRLSARRPRRQDRASARRLRRTTASSI